MGETNRIEGEGGGGKGAKNKSHFCQFPLLFSLFPLFSLIFTFSWFFLPEKVFWGPLKERYRMSEKDREKKRGMGGDKEKNMRGDQKKERRIKR